MKKRSSLELKKQILKHLSKHGETSLKMLEIKLKTSFRSIKIQCEELNYFKLIELIKQTKNPNTGRPSTSANVTQRGREFI
jgi:predicted ArsR family transcriptional regulator